MSRDRNIVQFYGACVQENNLLLVAEMMEVCMCFVTTIAFETFEVSGLIGGSMSFYIKDAVHGEAC